MHCGGWSDRLDGITLGYVIANLTNRRFGIQIPAMSCSLASFLEPNEVDKFTEGAARMETRTDDPRLNQAMETADLDTTFSARTALLNANMDVLDNLKMNKLYKQTLSWMQPLTRDQIFVRIDKKLFKLSPRTQAEIPVRVKRTTVVHSFPYGGL
ncbi:hypothetical protein BaRGS_00025262 [Batillaria attramentaria]|uniref:Uncharacterized protein n=1 Tax=Batillaria attramentaria TaxID=370345 RepID=A0ABD0K8R5_9CAEN